MKYYNWLNKSITKFLIFKMSKKFSYKHRYLSVNKLKYNFRLNFRAAIAQETEIIVQTASYKYTGVIY